MNSRVGRLEWWGTFAVTYFLYLQAMEFFARSMPRDGEFLSGVSVHPTVLLGVAQAVILGVALAVQHHASVRRARDRDVRPIAFWVYAATCVATFAISLAIVSSGVTLPFNLSWIWASPFVAFGWMAIELGARPGDPMANRWGPVPKSPFDRVGPRIDNYKPPRP
ncbi:DUF805 domain-containing protein [Brevundimonas viscosa]|uniref:DUF805 domain-containing protein n=1 Tax=Brevundimonas viscosa TaxID=871741 RepID=UPI00116041AE